MHGFITYHQSVNAGGALASSTKPVHESSHEERKLLAALLPVYAANEV